MKRVELIVAYDGTNYCGWQVQPNGITVEEVLNKALSKLLKEEITVDGASRTDSGVHARCNIAVFDTDSRIPAEKISYALNQILPEDIRIQGSREVPLDFHPRKCNSIKTYEYKILNRTFELPTSRLYAYFYHVPLNVEKMEEGAAYLIGEHDFSSYCSAKGQAKDTVRRIYSLDVVKEGEFITIRITGNGFLYNMVRIIAGSLIEVGRGFQTPEWILTVLEARDRTLAGRKAPAQGLTLVNFEYDTTLREMISSSNRFWDYTLVQREIPWKQKAYLIVRRCEDEEFLPLVERKTLQAFRNGAKQIFVADREKNIRLADEKQLGWFRVSYGYSLIHMELELVQGMGAEAEEDCELAAVPVTPQTADQFLQVYENCFSDVPGSGTLKKEELLEQLLDPCRCTAFISCSETVAGFFMLDIRADEVELDAIGILPEHAGRGIGHRALKYLIQIASQRNKKRIVLMVASTNQRALHLYEAAGFQKRGEPVNWYCLEETSASCS